MAERELSEEERLNIINELIELVIGFVGDKLEGTSRGELIHIVTASLYATLYGCICESAEDFDLVFIALINEVVRAYIVTK